MSRSEDAGLSLHQLALAAEQTLDRAFSGVNRIALLDLPAHSNVGDSAIFLGEIEFFRRRGIEVVYLCDFRTYDSSALRSRLSNDTAIAVHGGGNFGDLWPAHQAFRERVLADFPLTRVVQLPQSLHFRSEASAEASAGVCRAHRRFTLLVRDQVSAATAASFSDDVHLCPDSAHLVHYPAPPPASKAAVWLARTDIERRIDDVQRPAAVDWLEDRWSPAVWLQARAKRLARQGTQPRTAGRLMRMSAMSAAEQRVERGCRLLGAGRTVVTDRLHGVLLSLHLGRRVIAVDNNYGKLSSYIDTWLTDAAPLSRVDNWQEACRIELA